MRETARLAGLLARGLAFWGRLHPAIQLPAYATLATLHAWPWGGTGEIRDILPRALAAAAFLLIAHIAAAAAARTAKTGDLAAITAPATKTAGATLVGAGAVMALESNTEPEPEEDPRGWEDLLAGIVD